MFPIKYNGDILSHNARVGVDGGIVESLDFVNDFSEQTKRVNIPTIVTNGLVLYLDAGQTASYPGAGTTWTDLSGFGNNGILTNGASFDSANGGSIFFDGTNDWVNCGTGSTLTFNNGTNLNDVPFTISTWVRFNSVLGYQIVVAKSDYGANQRNFLLLLDNNSKIYFYLMNQTSFSNRIGRFYDSILSVNVWYNFTATYNGSKLESGMKIYVNGIKVDNGSGSSGTYTGLSNIDIPFSIGTDWATFPTQGNKLSGRVATMLTYRRELSDAEVLQNYNATRSRFGL